MYPYQLDRLNLIYLQSLVVKQLGIEAARHEVQQKVLDVKFVPKGSTSLGKPKFGKEDPENQPHTGGNTWAGGVRASFRFFGFVISHLQIDWWTGHCGARR